MRSFKPTEKSIKTLTLTHIPTVWIQQWIFCYTCVITYLATYTLIYSSCTLVYSSRVLPKYHLQCTVEDRILHSFGLSYALQSATTRLLSFSASHFSVLISSHPRHLVWSAHPCSFSLILQNPACPLRPRSYLLLTKPAVISLSYSDLSLLRFL